MIRKTFLAALAVTAALVALAPATASATGDGTRVTGTRVTTADTRELTATGAHADTRELAATSGSSRSARCARQFEAAQRVDMTSFRDFDKQAFRRAHDPRAVSIYGGSHVDYSRAQIMATLHDHFADKNAVWSWTELTRRVHGCRSAFIVYRTTYAIPSQNYSSELVTAVTYSYEHGRWLGVLDQSTPYRAGS